MSLTRFHQLVCSCGETLNVELISSINAAQDPNLKESILSGELNLIKCGNCFRLFYADSFVLYIDLPQEIIAFIYPAADESKKDELNKKTEIEFMSMCSSLTDEEKINIEPMVFFGMDKFSDFLKAENDMEDEIEVMRFICSQNKISTKTICKSRARKSKLPFILPKLKSKKNEKADQREEIIAGLNEVLKICPELTAYSSALQRITGDSSINL
ncbi:MAG: CpXC domain-containing protein [Elusimicrobiota bacterium]